MFLDSSFVRYFVKNKMFLKLTLFPSSGKGIKPYKSGPLDGAHLCPRGVKKLCKMSNELYFKCQQGEI